MDITKRKLGKTGVDITILGLGGEGILRTNGYWQEAYTLINKAIDLGINYFESARAYAGSELYYGKALKERRKDIFLTSKSHARNKSGALLHLQETLKNMETDYLDLWQVHDVRTEEELNGLFGPGGAIEAFIEAKDKGIARLVGVTGHHNPLITKKCIEIFNFDTVLIPVNPAEPQYRNFIDEVIPLANKKEMGIIGMKVYIRGFVSGLPLFKTMEPFFRFALSQPISTAVIGCDDIQQLEENVNFARYFNPMSDKEAQKFIFDISPYARKLMYYKP
jgi:predicted aldo/keto reductase-like oxidoreductase